MTTTDVFLDDNRVIITADTLRVSASDLLLDAPSRRKRQSGHRRALVHDQKDGLTINFNRDYPGGVTINDVVALEERPGFLTISATTLRVREIEGVATSGAGGPGGPGSTLAFAGAGLVLRGEISIEKTPSARALIPVSMETESAITNAPAAYPETISLQRTLQTLHEQMNALGERIALLEDDSRSKGREASRAQPNSIPARSHVDTPRPARTSRSRAKISRDSDGRPEE